ncbi:hypothetical protein EON82_16595 [bacterium]|nr:MAG: hypothetical protein EON82_16595 [bacterium]
MKSSTKNGLLVVILAVACGLGLSARPWMLARKESAEAARQVRQAEQDEAQMAKDRDQEAVLGTELGKEEQLRGQGYRKVGEQPLKQ